MLRVNHNSLEENWFDDISVPFAREPQVAKILSWKVRENFEVQLNRATEQKVRRHLVNSDLNRIKQYRRFGDLDNYGKCL